MRNNEDVFHIAIPSADLDDSREFFVDTLGCRLARQYTDRITLDFFGDQLVCHLSPENIESEPHMYPRHFGITFRHKRDFDALLNRVRSRGVNLFRDVSTRFSGQPEEHLTFFLCDPSNNILEFKHYLEPEMMY
jgi:extradiol dioxygenase family protein